MPWDREIIGPTWLDRPPRTCNVCKVVKQITSFYVGNGTCKSCYMQRTESWRKKNPDKFKKYMRKSSQRPKAKKAARDRANAKRRSDKGNDLREYNRNRNRGFKLQVIEAYGGKCVCCGEHRWQFLTIDHIFNDGKLHRSELRGSSIYRWLVKHNFPKDRFAVTCMNCNAARAWYGYCPHAREGSTDARASP